MNPLGTRLDALARRATQGQSLQDPAGQLPSRPMGQQSRRPRAVVLVVLVTLVGLFAWFSARPDSATLATVQDPDPHSTFSQSEATTPEPPNPTSAAVPSPVAVQPTPEPVEVAVPPFLVPPSDEWVVADYHGPDDQPEPQVAINSAHPGTWVFRFNGHLVIVQEGRQVRFADAPSAAEATIQMAENRAVTGWITDGVGVGIVALDIDEPEFRRVISQLRRDEVGWVLDGGDLVLAELAGTSPDEPREQVNFAPIQENGAADLSAVVIASTQVGSAGALYRELGEASSLGPVVERSIGGYAGFEILGQGPMSGSSWAAVAVEGRIFRFQTNGSVAGQDSSQQETFRAFLDSLEPGAEADWRRAIDQRDTNVQQAVQAVEVDPLGLPAPIDLPRFIPPVGWDPVWVTDMGIWTPEQRADRIAFTKARRPAGLSTGWPLQSRTQAFVVEDRREGDFIPDVIVNSGIFENEREIPLQPQNYTPLAVAGLTGSTLGNFAELHSPTVSVSINDAVLSDEELVGFVESLVIRQDDASLGFDVADRRFRQVFEFVHNDGPDTFETRPISTWTSMWRNGSSEAVIRAEQIGLDLHRVGLMRRGGLLEINDTSGVNSLIEGTTSTGFWRYNIETEILIEVSVLKGGGDARDFFDSLTPIDIEAWTARVESVNADPVKPR